MTENKLSEQVKKDIDSLKDDPSFRVPNALDEAFEEFGIKPITENLDAFIDGLGDGKREFEGLDTGMDEINKLIGGLNRFVLLAGMSGVGKSTLSVQLAIGVCQKEKIPVIYYSYEMDKRDVMTMAFQNISRKLLRNEVILRGNDPELEEEKKEDIRNTAQKFLEIADRFYIVDSSSKSTDLVDIKKGIKYLKKMHDTENVLVIIDSIQDVLPDPETLGKNVNQVQSEAQIAQKIVEIQQETGATILAIAQKNKSGIKDGGGYASVMGSVAFVHKPTTVLELVGGQEAIAKAKSDGSLIKSQIETLEKTLEDGTRNPNTPYPVYLNVIKGRNSGYGGEMFKYYGAYRYYEAGQDQHYVELYKTMKQLDMVD